MKKAMAAGWSLVIVILAIAIFMVGSNQSVYSWLEPLSKMFSSTPAKTNETVEQKNETKYEILSANDLRIFNVVWGKGNCTKVNGYALMNCRDDSFPKYPNGTCIIKSGYADVYVICRKDNLYCEVYVNGKRSDFAPNGLQKCENEIFVAENLISDNNFYTNLNEDKDILICCSYLDSTNTKILKDYEVCRSTALKAYCK
jgi:hypothetical protein